VSGAREQILKLLTMDWLVPETDIPGSTCLLIFKYFVFCRLLRDNALQPTVVRGNWRASDNCSSRSSYFACTGSSSPRGLTYPSAFCSFPPHLRVLTANHHLFFSFVLATSGMPCYWRMLSRTRGTCCLPSLRGRMDDG
jgi:hypothetical protein